jgi:type I restriction enzyme S subunit
MITLGDAAEFIMGQAPPGKDCNTDGVGTPFVKAGEFSDPAPVIREWTTNPLKFGTSKDVFICVVGATSGKINLGIDCAIGRSVAAIRPRNGKLDRQYLYYFLGTWTERLRSRSQGVAQGVITREMLSEIEIPLPPLPEQKRIADILDKADAIRRKRREAIVLLEQTVISHYEEIVGDPLVNPHSWRMTTLGERVDFVTGFAFQSSRYTDNNGIRLLRGANVLPDQVEWSDTCYWLIEDAVDDRFHLVANDVVLAMDRPWISTGIKVARVSESDLPCYLVQRVARLRSNSDVSQAFIYYSLRHPAFTTHCGNRKTETTVPHISPHDIRSFPIPDLPRKVHDRFSSTVSLLGSTIRDMQLASGDSLRLFNSLVQRAFRGEL